MSQITKNKKKLTAISNGFLSIFGLASVEDLRVFPHRQSAEDAFRKDLENIGLDILTSMKSFEEEKLSNEQKKQKEEFDTTK